MSDWFRATDESLRLLSEERLLVAATETVSAALERRGVTRSELADRLGVSKSEITQRLAGRRNLTMRSFASMLHELGYEVALNLRECRGTDDIETVHRSGRAMNWPSEHMNYSKRSIAPLRVIDGGHAA